MWFLLAFLAASGGPRSTKTSSGLSGHAISVKHIKSRRSSYLLSSPLLLRFSTMYTLTPCSFLEHADSNYSSMPDAPYQHIWKPNCSRMKPQDSSEHLSLNTFSANGGLSKKSSPITEPHSSKHSISYRNIMEYTTYEFPDTILVPMVLLNAPIAPSENPSSKPLMVMNLDGLTSFPQLFGPNELPSRNPLV
jgi:hypothetical protein